MCKVEQENIELKAKLARKEQLIADLRAKIIEMLEDAKG
jgi:hypothetical protein